MRIPHALIAGAGIGGLTASLTLARLGWRVSLFEKADILEEAGAGLQISPNASAILQGLGLNAPLQAMSFAPATIRLRRASDGSTLTALPVSGAEKRWGAPYLLIHRADLQKLLLDAVLRHPNITLRLGCQATGFSQEPKNVLLTVRQGSRTPDYPGDCLIGADGLRSLIRQQLVGGNLDKLRFSGKTAWRSLIPAERLPLSLRTPETHLWLGPRAHLVHYPLRKSSVINAVAIIDDSSGAELDQNQWAHPADPKFLSKSFASWDSDAKKIINAALVWTKWPLFERNRLLSWTSGRVTLLGDAAHPMLPFLAQGAAQAIEDAFALGQALGRPANLETMEARLKIYEKKRLARSAKVEIAASKQAEVYHLSGLPALARDLTLKVLGPNRLLANYDWLYQSRLTGKRS